MKTRFVVINPNATEFLMEIVMPLRDWVKIAALLREHGGLMSPHLELRHRIERMVNTAAKEWTGETEEIK